MNKMDLSTSDSDGSGDDWDELNEDELVNVSCLFCSDEFRGYDEALNHLKLQHLFDMPKLIKDYQLDDYSFRKFINFVRRHKLMPNDIGSVKNDAWNNDEYLTPIIPDDAWLMFGKFLLPVLNTLILNHYLFFKLTRI